MTGPQCPVHTTQTTPMAPLMLLIAMHALQGTATELQQPSASQQEFERQASSLVHEARTQMAVLVNQLMVNATIITQKAEGNASLLLANLYNDINRGVAEAQVKASQIGTTFQTNVSTSVEAVMKQVGQIYTSVELSLRNCTDHMEDTVMRLVNRTEEQLARTVDTAKAGMAAAGETPAVTSPVP